MAKIAIPDFIAKNHPSIEEKQRLMKQYTQWRKWEIAEIMVSHYEKQLDQLVQEDEKFTPLSWFQSKWNRARTLGKREILRKIIKDLKE